MYKVLLQVCIEDFMNGMIGCLDFAFKNSVYSGSAEYRSNRIGQTLIIVVNTVLHFVYF